MQAIILIGSMISGKSVIGRRLEEQFAARFCLPGINIDEAVEEIAWFLSECADD
ncbi:hypothetical protein ACFL4M_02160 [Pseudomonadota bacterium]